MRWTRPKPSVINEMLKPKRQRTIRILVQIQRAKTQKTTVWVFIEHLFVEY